MYHSAFDWKTPCVLHSHCQLVVDFGCSIAVSVCLFHRRKRENDFGVLFRSVRGDRPVLMRAAMENGLCYSRCTLGLVEPSFFLPLFLVGRKFPGMANLEHEEQMEVRFVKGIGWFQVKKVKTLKWKIRGWTNRGSINSGKRIESLILLVGTWYFSFMESIVRYSQNRQKEKVCTVILRDVSSSNFGDAFIGHTKWQQKFYHFERISHRITPKCTSM